MKKIVKSVQINKYYDELRFNRTLFFLLLRSGYQTKMDNKDS